MQAVFGFFVNLRRLAGIAVLSLVGINGHISFARNRPSECNFQQTRVVLDVGHTPESQGATSARGVSEFEFNVKLAQVIEAYLKERGLKNTVLLLVDGVGVAQLKARRQQAAALRPDFFVSIHHDSVQPQYLSSWEFEGKSHEYSDRFRGFSIFVSNSGENAPQSLAYAKLLAKELLIRGLPFTTHHAENIRGEGKELLEPKLGVYRNDHLAVLRDNTAGVAVLLEAGLIANRHEELELGSSERQELAAAAIWSAIEKFCQIDETLPK
jgi:N-acetylmuramoyl-L-alanine amidase